MEASSVSAKLLPLTANSVGHTGGPAQGWEKQQPQPLEPRLVRVSNILHAVSGPRRSWAGFNFIHHLLAQT